MKEYVPIEIIDDLGKKIWYLDVSRLGLGKLLYLRYELHGTNVNATRVLDGIIYKRIGARNRYVYDRVYTDAKDAKRYMKKEKMRKLTRVQRGMIR